MVNHFRAVFYRKFEGKDVRVSKNGIKIHYNALPEKKLKPPNSFVWNKRTYIYDPDAIEEYDNKGLPILKYYENNSLPIDSPKSPIKPIQKGKMKIPAILDTDGNVVIVDSQIFDKTLTRGEMKQIIASSQAEPKKIDWTTLILGIVVGATVGMMVMSIIYPSVFGHTTGGLVTTHAIIKKGLLEELGGMGSS